MFETSLIGTEGKPFRMVVERGKIREFAAATKAAHREYFDAEEPVAPPTFLASALHWEEPESSPFFNVDFDMARVLHGEQEYVFFGEPPRAGSSLKVASRIENVYERQGRRGGTLSFIVTVTDFFDDTGTLVAQSRSTVVQTETAPSPEENKP